MRKKKQEALAVAERFSSLVERPSGVQKVSRRVVGVPTDELLTYFAEGDEDAATLAVIRLYATVPHVTGTRPQLRDSELDARARWMVPFIDGQARLGTVIEASSLPEQDAVHAICVLLQRHLMRLE